jgi:hypothetical protein
MRIGRSLIALVLMATVMVILMSGTEAKATIIVENTAGTGVLANDEYLGQSLTTPLGVGWNDIQFSFLYEDLNTSVVTSVAFGTLYLFDSEYGGAPQALSTSGYLAQSTAISSGAFGDKYSFAPSVVLSPNTKYYFYADTQFPAGSINGGGDSYSGGENYFGGANASDNFILFSDLDTNFRLEGSPVPEPATVLLLGTGLVSLVGFRKKFKK